MSTYRTDKRENPFSQIDNRVINDPNLSWKAKGVLIYLLSKPNGWITQVGDIVKHAKDGRDAVYGAIKELIEARYITRIIDRSADGRVASVNYIVREEPLPGKPEVDNPDLAEPYISNTDLSNTESIHKRKERACVPDPLSKHPAIQLCRTITKKYPPSNLNEAIVDALGDDPDAIKLKMCYNEWCKRGYNRNAFVWAIDWYRTGIPQRNGGGKETFIPATMTIEEEIKASIRELERIGWA